MNIEQQNTLEGVSLSIAETPAKEAYHAPQIKMHGKLERMTLQDTSPGAGGGGGGNGDPPVDPNA